MRPGCCCPSVRLSCSATTTRVLGTAADESAASRTKENEGGSKEKRGSNIQKCYVCRLRTQNCLDWSAKPIVKSSGVSLFGSWVVWRTSGLTSWPPIRNVVPHTRCTLMLSIMYCCSWTFSITNSIRCHFVFVFFLNPHSLTLIVFVCSFLPVRWKSGVNCGDTNRTISPNFSPPSSLVTGFWSPANREQRRECLWAGRLNVDSLIRGYNTHEVKEKKNMVESDEIMAIWSCTEELYVESETKRSGCFCFFSFRSVLEAFRQQALPEESVTTT